MTEILRGSGSLSGERGSTVYGFHVAKDRGDLIERAKAEAQRQGKSFSWTICEALANYLQHKEIGRACPDCNGTGAREVQRGGSGYAVEDVEVECSTCGGTGLEAYSDGGREHRVTCEDCQGTGVRRDG